MWAWLDTARRARNIVPGDLITSHCIYLRFSYVCVHSPMHVRTLAIQTYHQAMASQHTHLRLLSCCHSQPAVTMADESDEDMMPASRSSNNRMAEEDMMPEPCIMHNSSNDTWRDIINNVWM